MIDRRTALASGTMALLSGCATLSIPDGRMRLGLADITVMRELSGDYAGTLKQVAALGYTTFGFRLFGYSGPSPMEPAPEEKAKMVRAAGLEIGAVRLSVRNANYDRELDIAAALGANTVVLTTAAPFISGPKRFETTLEKFQEWLPQLAALGEKARMRGLTLAYHNHEYDLAPLQGERPLDLMARQVPPELLSFELDLAWTWYAGVSPLDLLQQLGPRVVTMHWKDIDRGRAPDRSKIAVALGKGEMDYKSLLPRVRRITSALGYVEVDAPEDGLRAARQGSEIVRAALG